MSILKREKKELPVLSSSEPITQEEKPEPPKPAFITPYCETIGYVPEPQVKKPGYITVDRDGVECHHFTHEEVKQESLLDRILSTHAIEKLT